MHILRRLITLCQHKYFFTIFIDGNINYRHRMTGKTPFYQYIPGFYSTKKSNRF